MDHGYWSWRFNWFYVFDKQLKAENLANRVVLKKHIRKTSHEVDMNNSTYDDSGNDFKTADTFFYNKDD